MRCGSKSPEASQRVAASSDPETAAAGLVAAATMSEGCGVSLRGGPAICQRSRRALWDRRREGPAAVQCSAVPIKGADGDTPTSLRSISEAYLRLGVPRAASRRRRGKQDFVFLYIIYV